MQALRRAVIDVGTNSVKLLVADLAGPEIRRVCEESRQTRLGRGFYETHRLRAEAIAATTAAVDTPMNCLRVTLIVVSPSPVARVVVLEEAARSL